MDCDPTALANAARCFSKCIPDGMQPAVTTYLLANMVGITNTDQLLQAAKCWKCADGMHDAIKIFLLCNGVNLFESL